MTPGIGKRGAVSSRSFCRRSIWGWGARPGAGGGIGVGRGRGGRGLRGGSLTAPAGMDEITRTRMRQMLQNTQASRLMQGAMWDAFSAPGSLAFARAGPEAGAAYTEAAQKAGRNHDLGPPSAHMLRNAPRICMELGFCAKIDAGSTNLRPDKPEPEPLPGDPPVDLPRGPNRVDPPDAGALSFLSCLSRLLAYSVSSPLATPYHPLRLTRRFYHLHHTPLQSVLSALFVSRSTFLPPASCSQCLVSCFRRHALGVPARLCPPVSIVNLGRPMQCEEF